MGRWGISNNGRREERAKKLVSTFPLRVKVDRK